jgi:lipid-binding SYLF domain-containing protein
METKKPHITNVLFALACLAFILSPLVATTSNAKSKTADEINSEVDTVLKLFSQQVKGGQEILDSAKGVLIIPNVVKGVFLLGGEYGEGALRIGGKTVAYYNIAGGSIGLGVGWEEKHIIVAFMQDKDLEHFRMSSAWTVGFETGVTMIDHGKTYHADTFTIKHPVEAFVFGQKGLLLDASVAGIKVSKMEK